MSVKLSALPESEDLLQEVSARVDIISVENRRPDKVRDRRPDEVKNRRPDEVEDRRPEMYENRRPDIFLVMRIVLSF
jgi:hypothetical protein